MRPAFPRSFILRMALVSLTVAVTASLWIAVSFIPSVSSAYAETAFLSLTVDQGLSTIGQASHLNVSGEVSQSLVGATLGISVKGPIPVEQVGLDGVEAGVVHQFELSLTGGGTAEGDSGSAALKSWSTGQEMAAGTLKAVVKLPPSSLRKAGAYLVAVEVRKGRAVIASGETWVGRVRSSQSSVDVCFVLPVCVGIHRDWDGIFYDQTLEQASLPVESGAETIRGLTSLVGDLPGWDFTLALEPILLTQLRDMADGYVFDDASGDAVNVSANDLAAQNAAAVLSELSDLAKNGSVELVASPYAGADLGLLGAQGWRDGLEQIQMGKQELQSTLGLEAPLAGAYAPDLMVTDASLSYYADASIDHVVVSSSVRQDLSEELAPGTVAVRAENDSTDRVTLLFADEALAAAMAPPWDIGVFGAVMAARLAEGAEGALVIAPRDVFTLIPVSYLHDIGEILTSQQWARTQSLEDLLSEHPAGSRPVPLRTDPVQTERYIETSLSAGVSEAHVGVSDLATAADTAGVAVGRAHRLLYVAESRWWSRVGVSPTEASVGLAYAREAQSAAQEEMDKVRLAGADSSLMGDGTGVVRITVENTADYDFTATLRVAGEEVGFPEGQEQLVDLAPGRTEVEVEVLGEGGSRRIEITLLAGTTVLDELRHNVRFMGLGAVLPYLLTVIGLLVLYGVYLVVRWRRGSAKAS